ncbi:MAG: ADP-ribosylglycohydrolase family protein [Kiritimatiellia bacterium]|nr:ADP-ribosylglycohydrolase family protein [Kiritimatiellia bacterium]
MPQIALSKYRNKVLGCWLGKNIGGTLGAPFEWKRQINEVSFYTQTSLNGQPMPNDDLDIQLLWLVALEDLGMDVTARQLAEYWMTFVTPHWAEYGTAKINMRQGLPPPLSGIVQNAYKHSCGAYIRSEIWACIAPGLPRLAARFAVEDAQLDHGDGEGTYAEIFMAALESAAFFISDLRSLIDIGLSYVPADCGVARAVRTTLACLDSGKTWVETRDEILRLYRGKPHGPGAGDVSERDRKLGFADGNLGYDVPSNIAITLIGLLYGGDDFGAVQCIAVNCGEDTDCTAATAGSVWGIMYGAEAIPERWIEPIGRGIKTVCLNLGELGYFGSRLPQTVDELTDRTLRIAQQVLLRHGEPHALEAPSENEPLPPLSSWKVTDSGRSIWGLTTGPRYDFDGFRIHVEYGPDGPFIRDGVPTKIRLTIHRPSGIQSNLSLQWYVPEGWRVTPSASGYLLSLPGRFGPPQRLEYHLGTDHVARATNRAVFEITIEGRPTVMLIPITLLNGNVITVPAEVES